MRIVVGVSDLKVSNNPSDLIVTHALGSCLGVTAYDPVAGAGGLLHVMLPLSKADPEKALKKPAMYVDSGFQLLLNKLYELGATKKNLEIIVAGGASMGRSVENDFFKIGKRNFTVLRKLLWKNEFLISYQDIGGHISRNMSLSISDGAVTVNKVVINEKININEKNAVKRAI